jgi:hypothetical protein
MLRRDSDIRIRETYEVRAMKPLVSNRTALVSLLLFAAVFAGLAFIGGSAPGREVVSGTSTAWLSSDPGFEGYWKYCLKITWDVTEYGGKPHDVSHISIILNLEDCERACSPGYFAFADTAGSSVGGDGCTIYYYTEFNCKGDPTIPEGGPTIKFEPYTGECETGVSGTANVCFYCLAPPKLSTTFPSSVWIKFGLNVASGTLEGAMPNCIAPANSVRTSTWGAIKALLE